MPTYEYECKSCEHVFEEFQSIIAPPCKVCPKCGGEVKRLLGRGSTVIFKGSGFYATDYRSEEYKKRAKEEKGEKKTKEEGGDRGGKKEPSTEKKKDSSKNSKAE